MLIYLYRDSRDGTVHGSENKKSTGCRVNLQKPENITRYTAAGNAEDELAVLDKVTCSKCQTLFLKKMMKADSKERAQQAKEEKRKGKNAVDDANMVNLAEAQEQKRIEAEKARRHAEIAERQRQERLQREEEDKRRAEEEAKRRAEEAARRPQPAPAPAPAPAPEPKLPAYQEYVPPAKKTPAPQQHPTTTSFGGFAIDSDLAQFALPKTAVDPTAAQFAAGEGKNPNILAEQGAQTAPPPAPSSLDDIMQEFGIPAPTQKTESIDDLMKEFGFSDAPAQPAPAPVQEAPAPASPIAGMDDIMAQFAVPGSAPAATPAPKPAPAPVQEAPAPASPIAGMDDIMAQFAVPGSAPAAAPAPKPAPAPVQEAPAPASPIAGMDDIMAQFAVNAPAQPQVSAVPEAPAAPEVDEMDALMAKFSTPEETSPALESAAAAELLEAPKADDMDDLMAKFSALETPAEPEPQPVAEEPAPVAEPEPAPMPQRPTMDDFDAIADRMFGGTQEETAPPMPEPLSAEDMLLSGGTSEPVKAPEPKPAPAAVKAPEPTPAPAAAKAPEPAPAPAAVKVPEPTPAPTAVKAPEPTPVQEMPKAPQPAAVQPAPAPQVVQPPVQQPVQPAAQQGFQPQMGVAAGMMMPQQYMQPQFMGYDASGKPIYSYPQAAPQVMPQFMGYDASGKPIYAQPMQQPVAPMQPQPVSQQPVQPQHPAQPSLQGIHVSTVDQDKKEMPDVVRSALAKSAAPQGNIFDQQGGAVPVMDDIGAILSTMGEDTSQFQKKEKKEEPELQLEGFVEYKPRSKKSGKRGGSAMTEEEKRDQKRREKIDEDFKKKVAKKF